MRGMRAGLPVVFGFVPVGIAYAVMARQAGFTAAETVLMSLSVFAGASQMMAVGMVAQGAGLAAIILATFLLNLRHVIMSACVNHRLPRSGLAARLLAAFGVTDESFAIFTATPAENCTLPFFFGMITVTLLVLGGRFGHRRGGVRPAAAGALGQPGRGAVRHVHRPAAAKPAQQRPPGAAGRGDGGVQRAAGLRDGQQLGADPVHAGRGRPPACSGSIFRGRGENA